MNRYYFTRTHITLDDTCVKSATMSLQNAMVAESLEADTLVIRTIDRAMVNNEWQDGIPVDQLQYGDQLFIRPSEDRDDLRYFYLRSYRKVGEAEWEFELCSPIGMLAFTEHKGGIYNGETVEQIIKGDYENGIEPLIPWRTGSHSVNIYPVYIDADVAAVQLYGWLPITSARDNLVQILFSCGASLLKVGYEDDHANAGRMRIAFNEPTEASLDLTGDVVSISGKSANYVAPATSVTVVEHTFLASSETVDTVLFDNRDNSIPAADNYYVEFSAPYHSLNGNGLTINESGANYAIVSGKGYLTGKEYTHGKRKVTEETGIAGEPNDKLVQDCTLVNQFNVDNVIARVKAYYSLAIIDSLVAHTYKVKPGMLISYPDPTDTDNVKYGYVTNVDADLNKEMTARIKVASNWKPSNVGNTFNTSILIEASDLVGGKWTVPSWCANQPARVVLFGGGQGGHGSHDGGVSASITWDNDAGLTLSPRGTPVWREGTVYTQGGAGGAKGLGGDPGNIFSVPITLGAAGTQYPITIGVGGNGGGRDETSEPQDGGATTITANGTTYSSASGSHGSPTGYINIINGDIYALKGEDGEDGGDGGGAGEYEQTDTPIILDNGTELYFITHNKGGEYGGDVRRGNYYIGGGHGSEYREFFNPSGTRGRYCFGSGGGGASKDHNGTNASLPTASNYSSPDSSFRTTAGNGANGEQPPAETRLAYGGTGANGGGGAGAIGAYIYTNIDEFNHETVREIELGHAGTAGLGSNGGKGGEGFVLIYTHDTSKIEITTPPTKTAYDIGEQLDLSGMVVTATYADGTTEDVTAYCTASPADGEELTEDGDVTVIITYTHLDLTLQVEQQITVS